MPVPGAKDTFSLTEPFSPACALHPSHGTAGLGEPRPVRGHPAPPAPLSLCPVIWPKGQSKRKTDGVYINIYIYGHMHTSYTHTDLFSSLESTNQKIKDPLLSQRCVTYLKTLTRAACCNAEIVRLEHIHGHRGVDSLCPQVVCSSGCSARPADPVGMLRLPGPLLTTWLLFHTLE